MAVSTIWVKFATAKPSSVDVELAVQEQVLALQSRYAPTGYRLTISKPVTKRFGKETTWPATVVTATKDVGTKLKSNWVISTYLICVEVAEDDEESAAVPYDAGNDEIE